MSDHAHRWAKIGAGDTCISCYPCMFLFGVVQFHSGDRFNILLTVDMITGVPHYTQVMDNCDDSVVFGEVCFLSGCLIR